MKLFRYHDEGLIKQGAILNSQAYDVTAFGADFDEAFLCNDGVKHLKTWIGLNLDKCLRLNLAALGKDLRLAPCLARPSKIVCIGLNYIDHANETKSPVPKEPIIFMKATSAINGCNDKVVIPRTSIKTDYEVELACIIGKKATYVEECEALSYLAGYCIMIDYSERDFQKERGGQWVKGKSADTFAPLGPYFVSADEIPDCQNLQMWLKVNSQVRQQSSTAQMIFPVARLISYISQFMSLLPGDIISTGTPAGVGMGMNPPVFLKPGDVVSYGIEGLGEASHIISSLE